MFRKFSQWFDVPHGQKGAFKSPHKHSCDHEGCPDEGIYRAPKSRYHLETGANDWYWFCLIHIRDYNAKWNYHLNMSDEEIERERRADITAHRPTWPLGGASDYPKVEKIYTDPSVQDPFGLFEDTAASLKQYATQSPEGKALVLLELSYPFTPDELRKQYLRLVKQHHPDTNEGSPEAVEALKRINEAYEVLKRLFER